MPVVNMAVCNHMDQFPRLQAGHLSHHVGQQGILDHVPVVGGEHILAPLIQNGVQGMSRHIERHGIGTGVQVHLVEILKIIDIGQDPPGSRVVLQIVEHPVHLVKHPLFVLVLDPQLVAVGLADGAVRTGPLIPDMAAQVRDPVGFLLPDPQQFIHGALPIGPAQGHNGELLCQIIAVHHTKLLDGVGGSSVGPVRAHLQVFIGKAVGQNVPAGGFVQFVGSAHRSPSKIFTSQPFSSRGSPSSMCLPEKSSVPVAGLGITRQAGL